MNPITKSILSWYDVNRRKLPWRDEVSPYRSLLSEFMLQQTRVETVKPYFHQFLQRYPKLEDLAAASEQEVLEMWAGLGYYRRARFLHRSAKAIAELGSFPSTAKELIKLPGVGEYMAGAIASIAFGQCEAAVDGNHHRVFSRLFRDSSERKGIWKIANKLLPKKRAGDFNQAVMDIGSGICRAKNPLCSECPVSQHCKAYLANDIHLYPYKKPKKKVPVRYLVCGQGSHPNDATQFLFVKRPETGLYASMYELPSFFVENNERLAKQLATKWQAEFGVPCTVLDQQSVFKHVLTHMELHVYVFRLQSPLPIDFQFYQDPVWSKDGNSLPLSSLAKKTLQPKATMKSNHQLSLFAADTK